MNVVAIVNKFKTPSVKCRTAIFCIHTSKVPMMDGILIGINISQQHVSSKSVGINTTVHSCLARVR